MDLTPRRELAQRIEAIEASVSEACIEAMLAAYPSSGAVTEEIGGGRSFFFGPMSPLSQAVGVGMRGPVSKEEFDRLEEFFFLRGSPVAISLCPHAHASVLERLADRRYRITQFEHTLVRELNGREAFIAPPPSLIRPALASEAALWARTAMEGFQAGASGFEGFEGLFAIMFSAPRTTALLAWQDGRAVGGAAVSICAGESAMFFSDSTLPDFRRRGVQSGLIEARLQLAGAAGCRLAVACAGPGTTSQRNYERAGFRVAYTKAILTSP